MSMAMTFKVKHEMKMRKWHAFQQMHKSGLALSFKAERYGSDMNNWNGNRLPLSCKFWLVFWRNITFKLSHTQRARKWLFTGLAVRISQVFSSKILGYWIISLVYTWSTMENFGLLVLLEMYCNIARCIFSISSSSFHFLL